MKRITLLSLLLFIAIQNYGQQKDKSFLIPYKIGLLYSNANEKNFLFDDTDYFYKTNTLKGQLFYKLGKVLSVDLELAIQPQVQFLRHQLLNPFYITPNIPDYLSKRKTYTQLKSMHLYALEFGLAFKKQLFSQLSLQITAGVGVSYIDTATERLAKGFTFIENGSIGLNIQTSATTILYLGGTIGHVSNFDFQLPNDGYNILGFELGFNYILQ